LVSQDPFLISRDPFSVGQDAFPVCWDPFSVIQIHLNKTFISVDLNLILILLQLGGNSKNAMIWFLLDFNFSENER
jgi:hypothetical protein